MLSVVLATYNEESNITRCLEAVVEIADEIIVVDGSSTDETAKLARAAGARVLNTTNKPNFHINKQLAIDEAKGELILQLDADEIVDDELQSFISRLHDKLTTSPNWTGPVAWYLQRKNHFLGSFLRKGGQYPDPVIRLFLKGKANLPQKDVHEQMSVDGETATAEGHLLHYSNPSFADYLRKFNTYTSFTAQSAFKKETAISAGNTVEWFVIKPLSTFFTLYLRHKGFVDGVPGFVFALMSGLHHPVAYLKLWELHESTASTSTAPTNLHPKPSITSSVKVSSTKKRPKK
jgi:glycosyltransferase involved in cell wall biosynthesis